MSLTIPTTLPSVVSLADPLDSRDLIYEFNDKAILPSSVDLRPQEATIEDQGAEGSCTAQAVVGSCEAFLRSASALFDLSRNFNYYTSRELLGPSWLAVDQGSTLREALRAANKLGLCSEVMWPYSPATLFQRPSDAAYAEAIEQRIGGYYRIPVFGDPNTGPDMTTQSAIFGTRYALAKGYPVAASFRVGERIRTLQKDQIYLPISSDNPQIGGHAIVIVGYLWIAGNLVFICRNSWGAGYCDAGYFLISSVVIQANTIDLWVVKGFAGLSTVGADLVIEEPPAPVPPAVPTCDSTMGDVVRYVFRTKFGRMPLQGGLDYWSQRTLDYMLHQIPVEAGPADKQYMIDHNITP